MSAGLAERPVSDVLAALAGEAPAPAAGSALALTVGMAASLVVKCARKAEGRMEQAVGVGARAGSLRRRAEALADEDMAAYGEVLHASGDGARAEALGRASEPPLAVVELGSELAEAAAELTANGKPALRGDAYAATLLAEGAARAAAALVAMNAGQASSGGTAPPDDRVERAHRLVAAAEEARTRAGAVLEGHGVR